LLSPASARWALGEVVKGADPAADKRGARKMMTVAELCDRDAVAAALTAAGFPVKSKTLATKASRGGGPTFRRFGVKPLYRWADAVAWAQSRLGPVIFSTSEGDVGAAGLPDRQPEGRSTVELTGPTAASAQRPRPRARLIVK
jgi:hypothetical protein